MYKFATAAAIGLFAIAAHAQSNPPGASVPPATPGVATGKAEMAGEAKKDARTPGMVQSQGANTTSMAQGTATAQRRDARAEKVEAGKDKRDQKHPNAMPAGQGGTPK